MTSAVLALVAAAVFFAGVLYGSAGPSGDGPLPQPVVLRVAAPQPPNQGAREEVRNGPAAEDLDVAEVEHTVDEGYVQDGGGYVDSSGSGSGAQPEVEKPEGGDHSGPGSGGTGETQDESGSGSDNSGPGSGSSGSGSSGSGGGGSDTG